MGGSLTDFNVTVDISHTYKGDLETYLQRPDGSFIKLHDNTGGSANDIQTTYDTLTMPTQSLSLLFGGSPNGTWTLWAFDLAAQDTGSIDGWSLEVETDGAGGGGPTTTTHSANDVPINIPDNNSTGILSNLTVSGASGSLSDVEVTVNITHTYKGDLEVILIHPDGTQLFLHNNTGGSANNIITTYPSPTAPAQSLNALDGKSPAGTWGLRVKDLAGADVGTLNSWSLTLTY